MNIDSYAPTMDVADDVGYQPYIDLAAAILKQAAADYLAADRALRKYPGSPRYIQKLLDLERFFHSKWFAQLSMGMEPYWFKKVIVSAGGVANNALNHPGKRLEAERRGFH